MPVPMMPRLNSRKVASPASGPQRLRRLRRGLDVFDPRRVERRRGADDDEQRDEVREAHADVGVDLDPSQMPARAFRRSRLSGARRGIGLDLLDFLRRLPEEEVRADRRPEHCDDYRQRLPGQREPRPDDADDRLAPRNRDREDDRDVSEQRKRQPFEIFERSADRAGTPAAADPRRRTGGCTDASSRRRRAQAHRPSRQCRRRR